MVKRMSVSKEMRICKRLWICKRMWMRERMFAGKKMYVGASITVEAVFVIPFVIILFLMLLWLSLYLHDKSVIEGALFQTMEEGGDYVLYGVRPGIGLTAEDGGSKGNLHYAIAGASEEEVQIWEERFCREISGKLFLYHLSKLECKKTITGTKVYAKFCCAEFFPAGQWGLSAFFCMEYMHDRLCPVREEVTRGGSILLDLYEEKRK